MMKIIKDVLDIKKMLYVFAGAVLVSVGLNIFFVPVNLYGGGLTGLAMIINSFTKGALPFGAILIILNTPIMVLGWFKLGPKFTIYTIISIISVSALTSIIPIMDPISDEKLLMSVYGGILIGLGVAITLKVGGSTGGSDVIALYLSDKFGGSIGNYATAINVLVLSAVALLFDMEIVLFTIIGLYISSTVIDALHSRYKKLTVTINTCNSADFIKAYQEVSPRGVTIIHATGAYTNTPRELLYIVITSYELTSLLELLKEYDEYAFVNVTKSDRVIGKFIKIED